jgi:hypothetical protein
MPTQPLSTEECEVLGVLVDPDVPAPDRTVAALARQADLSPKLVAARLEALESRSPPLVTRGPDDEWEVQAWSATDDGRRAWEERCGP